MARITITLGDGSVRILEARSLDAPTQFAWGYGIVLRQPVTLDGVPLAIGASLSFAPHTGISLDTGVVHTGRVEIFAADEDAVSLRIFTVDDNVPVLQANADDGIGAFSGSVGPFNYMVDVHLDMENPMASAFIVQLSCMGVTLADVHMDAQHSTAKIGASIAGAGVDGMLGVDFEQQRIYASITLGYFIGEKKYDFDLYHWGNCNVQMLPIVQSNGDDASVAMYALQNGDTGGSITVRNNGGYVAKFKVAFTLNGQRIEKESENFTLGVNKQLDIPADAVDIQVEALAAWFVGAWSSIFTVGFDAPVRKTFEVSGTTLKTNYKEI